MRLIRTTFLPRTEAGEEHNERPPEEQDHGHEDGPHAGRVVSVRATAVLVDVIFDDLVRTQPDQFRIASMGWDKNEHTPKSEKSTAMTISVSSQANPATRAERSEPKTPAPSASRKAMKARPQAMGCRIMTCVSPSALLEPTLSKRLPSMAAMMAAGL